MKPNSNIILHKLSLETGTQKVMEVLYQFPEKEFSLSDLAKEAGVAKANIGKILDSLYKMKFLEIAKLSKLWRIKANQQSWIYKRAKIVRNLNIIYQSGLPELLNDHYNNPRAIILFGSFRMGEDISTSDIDIAIETDVNDYTVTALRELDGIEKIIGRKIQLHLFARKNVDVNVFNNIANGIVLLGFLEVNP